MKFILYIFFILTICKSYSQGIFNTNKNKKPLVTVTKTGPYIGLQRGKYNNLELGYELQKKAIKLIKPTINSFNIGFDYNLTENILGFSADYWRKKGRLDLTYGGRVIFKSNFDNNRFGFSPTVGYKLSLFHFQVGYNILMPTNTFTNTNTLFVSLRLTFVNNRNFNWRKRKKKKN